MFTRLLLLYEEYKNDFFFQFHKFSMMSCLCLILLGSVELDLHGFPHGAKTAKDCKMEMLNNPSDNLSIFQQKRAKGWWPFVKAEELTVC